MDSILNGHEVIEDYGDGNPRTRREGDLRQYLVDRIVDRLFSSTSFTKEIAKKIEGDFVKRLEQRLIENFKWDALPYGWRSNIENRIKNDKDFLKIHSIDVEVQVVPKNN